MLILQSSLAHFLCALSLVPLCTSSACSHGNTSTDAGSFLNPAPISRPVFRYWLPDAGVDASIVRDDISGAAYVGAGGIELLPFFEYGGQLGGMPAGTNWSTYNFGTAAFHNILSVALDAHEKHGLKIDIPLGPNQGQGVPAHPDDEGLQWDLVPFNDTVQADGLYTGVIPGWGTGELVALVSALVTSHTTVSYGGAGISGSTNVTYEDLILSADSLTEWTELVSADGVINLTFPVAETGSHYRVFTFYQRLSGHGNLVFDSSVHNSIFDDGSYVVDHYSARGAETVAKFWKEHILQDGIREKLKKVGRYLWEDSPEFLSNISWSSTLPERFQELNGYSIKPVLPLLAYKQNSISDTNDAPGPFNCILDTDTKGVEHVNAYRKTLSEGYKEYLTALKSWINGDLGLELSVQPAYGLPMDMEDSISSVDAPETESLFFKDSIDSYRQFAGPAHLSGKNIISNELGAVAVRRTAITSPICCSPLTADLRRASTDMSCTASRTPEHIFRPGPVTRPSTIYSQSLIHPDSLPGITECYIQQSGTAKVDIAIYNKESATSKTRIGYNSSDLVDAGWSYNYLNPNNLESSQAVVKDGVLASDGPAWTALIVESAANISLSAVASLKRLASAGLPVVFVGDNFNLYPDGQDANLTVFQQELETLQSYSNVYAAGEGELANKITELGLSPRVGVSTNGTWYTTLRELNASSYVFVYADLVGSRGSVIVKDTRMPFFLNPWTGAQSPVLIYERSNTTTTIPLSLSGNQTVIILFSDAETSHNFDYHIVSVPDNAASATTAGDGTVSVQVSNSAADTEATMSDGSICALGGSHVPAAFSITNWNLTAEHWAAPANLSETSPTSKRNTTHSLPELLSWGDIPELVNSSGLGYYSASFIWPPLSNTTSDETATLGAVISFGRLLHYARASINGQPLPPLDVTNAVADITPYLTEGENRVEAVVPTTMWNYLRTILDDLKSAGQPPLLLELSGVIGSEPLNATDATGLVGVVSVTPYLSVTC
ncbi:hypothetical protein PFICI_00288 [Pestalotiopsis fici W106-1]|uniref:Uncharacterized protein n=1 Tax=Pestalotiopsis fici (strain W106-1 / CGMCC3.15140) TaxID=1229662 RepID=W3XKD3_PESFW|nr:uncharacterized protein PFICI_00288 [Pestalotiopsis fici W106-1]ETS86460.1 hypothetical protein PFICI_00288 [Pestalotiopsis fici W106-1]